VQDKLSQRNSNHPEMNLTETGYEGANWIEIAQAFVILVTKLHAL
jgi:hypothetical protein